MRSIDIHAHLTPQCLIRATQAGQEWHGIRPGSVRIAPRAVWTPEQRIADMNSLGVDVQVVSTGAGFYYYDRDAQPVAAMHRDCNDEVHQMTMDLQSALRVSRKFRCRTCQRPLLSWTGRSTSSA